MPIGLAQRLARLVDGQRIHILADDAGQVALARQVQELRAVAGLQALIVERDAQRRDEGAVGFAGRLPARRAPRASHQHARRIVLAPPASDCRGRCRWPSGTAGPRPSRSIVRLTGAENPRSSEGTGREGTSRKRKVSVRLATSMSAVLQALAGGQRERDVLPVAAQQPQPHRHVQRLLLGLARRGRQHLGMVSSARLRRARRT